MKLNKNQLSVVKSIIKEEIEKFQKKTLLESEKKKLMKEFEMLKGEFTGNIQVAEAAAKAIGEGLFDIYDYTENYLLLQVDLPRIGEVYVNFDIEVKAYETPYYKPSTMYSPNGDPGNPDEGSGGELGFILKKVEISKDLEGNEVLFSGMNNSLTAEFEQLSENHKIFDDISERYWNEWSEDRQDNRDDDDYSRYEKF